MTALLLLLSLGCRSATPAADAPVAMSVASAKTTLASADALGAYVLEAHEDVTVDRGASSTTVHDTTRLRWANAGQWSWERGREGKPVSEVRVWDGVAWQSHGEGPLRRRGDAAPALAELTRDADPWKGAIGVNEDRVVYTEAGHEDIEGRKVLRYTLGLAESAASGRRSREVQEIAGEVWVDEATAVRLAGDVTLKVRFREQVTTTHLRFSMSNIGGDAQIAPPGEGTP